MTAPHPPADVSILLSPANADFAQIHALLASTSWSPNIRPDVVATAFRNSLFALAIQAPTERIALDGGGRVVGTARVVTDYATFAWLCDVYVVPELRGTGLARAMILNLQVHPGLGTLRRWCLTTQDAHGLYAKLGFVPVMADAWMERKSTPPQPGSKPPAPADRRRCTQNSLAGYRSLMPQSSTHGSRSRPAAASCVAVALLGAVGCAPAAWALVQTATSTPAAPIAPATPTPPPPPPPPTPAPPATPVNVTPAAPAAEQAAPSTRPTYRLDAAGGWMAQPGPADGSDEARILSARRLLAEDRPEEALTILTAYVEQYERSSNPLLSQAYLLRGDATSAAGNEYKALYDYETVIRAFPGTPEFVTAVERELEIGIRYLQGLDRKFLGMRFVPAIEEGEELLIRVQERLPGSRLAERAGIELADHYYRIRELKLAAEAYELFMQNFPLSSYRAKAMQRRVFANIARFKGPRYDAAALTDAATLIRRFMSLYPAQAEQAGLDDALLTRIDESGGQQFLEVARWYLVRNDPVAARLTLRRLIARHPQTAAAAEALRILTERGWLELSPASAPAASPAASQDQPK
ncbi:MAG: GNAT family N-acetyltransferase [bacterium]